MDAERVVAVGLTGCTYSLCDCAVERALQPSSVSVLRTYCQERIVVSVLDSNLSLVLSR